MTKGTVPFVTRDRDGRAYGHATGYAEFQITYTDMVTSQRRADGLSLTHKYYQSERPGIISFVYNGMRKKNFEKTLPPHEVKNCLEQLFLQNPAAW